MPLLEPDETARAAIARLHEYARAAGRDPHSIGIEGVVLLGDKSRDTLRREVDAWEALGVTSLTLYALDAGLSSLQAHIDAIGRFREVVDSSAQA